MNKTDRLIITFSIGVFLLSTVYTIATVRKENIKIARSEREILKTIFTFYLKTIKKSLIDDEKHFSIGFIKNFAQIGA